MRTNRVQHFNTKAADQIHALALWLQTGAPGGSVPLFVARLLHGFYGILTGTEFSGSRIHRTLKAEWHEAVAMRVENPDTIQGMKVDYATQISVQRIRNIPASRVQAYLCADYVQRRMHEKADSLIVHGFSRYDAQVEVIRWARTAPYFF
jgi:hypothetical protein